jgi:hypothetical protein
MGIDTFSEDQYSFVLDDRKKALKNYIQALISIQEDPALHIKKLSEKLAKMYVDQKEEKPLFFGIDGSRNS